MSDYPAHPIEAGHVEPVPRRIRAYLDGRPVLDTTRALYMWEWPNYPRYYIPLADVAEGVLVDEGRTTQGRQGSFDVYGVQAASGYRPGAAKVLRRSSVEGLSDTVRFDWQAVDAWFEEDEQVFVHPRSPYVRVDALRSTRRVRVELDGLVPAESASTVMVFETGLPTRYYFNRTEIDFTHLVPSATVTECPYKGTTSGYWSVRTGEAVQPDLAWTYDFPARQLLPISGLISFYNEKVDLTVDGVALERPVTHFFRS